MSLSREKINYLSQILAKGLVELPGVTFHAPENTVRLEIVRAIQDALKLEDAGAVAVMPLASPIGSGLGMLNPYAIRTIKQRLSVPVIVDAGVGTASDACVVMEQGVDGILMNTGIAAAQDPVRMAAAMKSAVESGRNAYLAGRMPRREVAVPSSPTTGMLGS